MIKITDELKHEILMLYPEKGAALTAKAVHLEYFRCTKVIKEAGIWKKPRNTIKSLTKELGAYPDMDYKEILKIAPNKSMLKAFIQDFCKAYRVHTNQKLAKKYNISIAVVDRLRRRIGIPVMSSDDHPGRKLIKKRIRKMYLGEGKSTLYIGKILRVSSQFVQNMLHEMRITMNPAHNVNAKYFSTRSELSPSRLLKEIKRLYEEEKKPLKEIAKIVGIWEGTVSSKLRAMGIPIVTRRKMRKGFTLKPGYNIIGIYNGTSDPYVLWYFSGEGYTFLGPRTPKGKVKSCLWCNAPFIPNISKGPRTQIFHNPGCRNKAKDLRRGLKPRMNKGKMKVSLGRFRKLALEFTGDIDKLGLSDEVKKEVIKVRRGIKWEWRK